MKKILVTLLVAILAIPAFAGVKLVSGSLGELKDAKKVSVVLNWDKAVYSKAGTLNDFLDKAERNSDWEEASMNYFYKKINSKTGEYGLRFVNQAEAPDAIYTLEIVPATISKGGDLTGEIYLKKSGMDEPIAVVTFSSDESDDDDKIAFRDQLESIGQSLAKLVVKQIKK